MANEEQLQHLRRDVLSWNMWRDQCRTLEPNTMIDLSEANLSGANLTGADLGKADLSGTTLSKAKLIAANLSDAKLFETNLMGADLTRAVLDDAVLIGSNLRRANLDNAELVRANLRGVNLRYANFTEANLIEADLFEADLSEANLTRALLDGADLRKADLTKANLTEARLINSNLLQAKISNARISKSRVYGINVWDLNGEFKEQKDLIITDLDEPVITVDNIEVAQFIYLILNNKKLRNVINTLTSKSVLILGRFAIPERKAILDALRNKLREYDLLPIVFDFDRPIDKDFTETIKTLAGISCFVIADVTNPKSSPLELQATVPDYQIPFVPIIQEGESPFAMMANLQTKYSWVLDTISYDSLDTLIEILKPHIIDPAIKKHNEFRKIKANVPTIISGREMKDKK